MIFKEESNILCICLSSFLFWVFYMELTVIADSVEFINAFKKIEKFLSCSYHEFNYIPYVHFCVEGDSLCILASRRVTFIYIKVKVRSLEDVKFNWQEDSRFLSRR